jgi:hypothetical protein
VAALPFKEESMPRFVACLLALVGSMLLGGCWGGSPPASIDGQPPDDATSTSAPVETFPYVIARDVEYYTTGPQQGRPPDGTLPAGTKVNVRRRTGGYWLVRSAEGVEGYVLGESVHEPGTEPLP